MVRNAAPSGSLFVVVVVGAFGLSVDRGGDCCVAGGSSSSFTNGEKFLSLPRICEDDGFREEADELDLDRSLNNPIRPSSLE